MKPFYQSASAKCTRSRWHSAAAILLALSFCTAATAQNTALNFDNTNQGNGRSARLSNSVTLKPGLVTVEAWAKSTLWHRPAGDNTVISCTQGGGYAIYVQAGTGNLVFIAYANGTYQGGSVAASTTLVNGQWHHLAGTWDGTTARLYVDGVLKASSATLGSSFNITYGNNANYLFAGAESAGTSTSPEANRYFDGQIDEIKIWNYARSAAQIRSTILTAPALNATGLLAYYRCNEGTGTALSNSCTNTSGVNGTLINSATWFANSPVRFSANAVNFDGVDDKITTSLSVSGQSAFTIEGRIYPTSTGNNIAFFGQNDAIEIGFSNSNTITAQTANTGAGGSNSASWTFDNSSFPLNTWHHIAFVANGSQMFLYVDGILRTTVNNALANYGSSSDFFKIGAEVWDNVGNHFSGSIDEVRIWNVARSQAQIQSAMNVEIDPTLQTGLVAYYTFNQGIGAGTNTGFVTLLDQSGNNNGTLTNMAMSGAGSNFIAQQSGFFTLPLKWVSFTAKKLTDQVQLQWTTAHEQNTKEFIVQHRNAAGDWNDIGTIAAQRGMDYTFTHINPAAGINYYRIQQKDTDGKFSYSKVVTAAFESAKSFVKVFPNPVQGGEMSVQLTGASHIRLFNTEGKLVLQRKLEAGTTRVDVRALPAGIYRLHAGKDHFNVVIR